MSSQPLLTVRFPPFVHSGRSWARMNIDLLAALVPALVAAVFWFGLDALRVVALSGAVAVAADALAERLLGREPRINDASALVIGVLFAFLLPAGAPWWLVVSGSALSTLLGRQVFGGAGGNPLNPAVVGWAVCKISWPTQMTPDFAMLDTTLDYPLAHLKYFGPGYAGDFPLWDLLLGGQLGGLGAVQVLPLLLGGAYLLWRGVIRPHVPLAFLLGTALTATFFHLLWPDQTLGAAFHLLTGSAVFAALFLMPECASSPVTRWGMLIYGVFGGTMVVIIRHWGIYPDGAPFAVLLANLATPLLDRIRPKAFGKGRHA